MREVQNTADRKKVDRQAKDIIIADKTTTNRADSRNSEETNRVIKKLISLEC